MISPARAISTLVTAVVLVTGLSGCNRTEEKASDAPAAAPVYITMEVHDFDFNKPGNLSYGVFNYTGPNAKHRYISFIVHDVTKLVSYVSDAPGQFMLTVDGQQYDMHTYNPSITPYDGVNYWSQPIEEQAAAGAIELAVEVGGTTRRASFNVGSPFSLASAGVPFESYDPTVDPLALTWSEDYRVTNVNITSIDESGMTAECNSVDGFDSGAIADAHELVIPAGTIVHDCGTLLLSVSAEKVVEYTSEGVEELSLTVSGWYWANLGEPKPVSEER